MPKISVIVPVYKVEEYIHQCVDSILNQTFTDFEVILVDDGSPDNCGAICDQYAELNKRVKVIHQKNGGLSAARNAGLDVMIGDYVTFVDSDDVIHPQMLEYLYNVLNSKEADISVCNYAIFIDKIPCLEMVWESPLELYSGKEVCWKLFSEEQRIYVTAWGKLYKSQLFKGIRFPVGKIHEDNATTYKLYYLSRRVAFTPLSMYYYRQNPKGIMHTRTYDKTCHELDAYKNEIEFWKEHGEKEFQKAAEGKFEWRKTIINIEANQVKQRNLIPKEYRMPLLLAIRRVYHNCEYKHFIKYLGMAYPYLVKPYAFIYKLRHNQN